MPALNPFNPKENQSFIFIKDYLAEGSPAEGTKVTTSFKKGDVVTGTVIDMTPLDGGMVLNFIKGGLAYTINLQHGTQMGAVDSPLREYANNNNSGGGNIAISKKNIFTPKNILIGIIIIAIILGILKLTKII